MNIRIFSTKKYGFTRNLYGYYLVKTPFDEGLCLACARVLSHEINAFCFKCKAPTPPDWTTGNKSLDSFIMESCGNVRNKYDAYIQWIQYSLFTNIQEMTSLRHGCTHIAELTMDDVSTKVTLKKIIDDFDQVNYFTCKQCNRKYIK